MTPGARPLCVLSVGRSGSSLATGVLGALGYELGPEAGHYPADRHNVRGYFEIRAMNDLNDEILAALGGSLWSPPPMPDGWHRRPEMRAFVERARALVASTYRTGGRWAFKDTRTIWTLALWREVVGEMDYILCTRAPEEVVGSLTPLLPGRTPEELLLAWARANTQALRATAGERRLVLRYEDWFADAEVTAERLAAFAGVPLDDVSRRVLAGRVEPGLRHQLASGDELPIEARMLDGALRVLAHGPDPALEALATTLDGELEGRLAREDLLTAPAAGRDRGRLPLPIVVGAFPRAEETALLREIADDLGPWLQGPFPLTAGLAVEGAWRCDERWGALAAVVGRLAGERVLDVGANAGYDAFMLSTLGAGHVLGVEPYGFHDQAVFLERLYSTGVQFERIGWQALDPGVHGRFDLVHCGSLLLREPHVLRLLLKLRAMTADGGRLLLGTVVEDGAADGRMRFIAGSVAGDPTWWWVPDAVALRELLSAVGFDMLEEVRAGDQPVAPFSCSARYVLARAARAPSEELLAADLPAEVRA